MTKGKLVLKKAESLKEGDRVIWNNHTYNIVDKYSDDYEIKHDQLSLLFADQCMKNSTDTTLQQFHVEWEDRIGEYYKKQYGDELNNSLPLSFSDYPLALEIGVGNEVEFESTNKCCGRCDGINDICVYDMAKKPTEFAKLVVKEEKKELPEHGPHECPLCNVQCNCDSQPCICCFELGQLDWELNKFAHHCLTNRIKFNDSNQIAQEIINYLKQK